MDGKIAFTSLVLTTYNVHVPSLQIEGAEPNFFTWRIVLLAQLHDVAGRCRGVDKIKLERTWAPNTRMRKHFHAFAAPPITR